MPRASSDEFLQRHQDVEQLWLKFPETFVVLNPLDQWRIRGYYQTRHRSRRPAPPLGDRLGREQHSLPQAAGKVYHQLNRCFQIANHYGQSEPMGLFRAITSLTVSEQARLKQQIGISIHAVARPTLEIELLACTLIRITEAQLEALDDDLDHAA
jgi:hypothetical protein